MKGKKTLIIILAVVAVIVILIGSAAGSYNSLVDAQTAVETKQADRRTETSWK